MFAASFSGILLEADLGGPPAFLGSSPAAPASCDPAAFFIGEPECGAAEPSGHPGPFPCAPPSPTCASPQLLHRTTASARDLLRELESTDDLLPANSNDPLSMDVHELLLGGEGSLDPPLSHPAAGASSQAAPTSWRRSPPAASPSTPPTGTSLAWPPSFPAIPEESELPAGQLLPIPSPTAVAPSAPAAAALSTQLAMPASSPLSVFVPVPAATAAKALPGSPVSSLAHTNSSPRRSSEAGSPTSSASSGPDAYLPGSASPEADAARVPRIASMPNLHFSLGPADSGSGSSDMVGSGSGPGRRAAAGGAATSTRAMTRSRSHSDLKGAGSGSGAASLKNYNVPHLPFLTPPHLRKGKGGRQPASDPRLDPRIDPKKARRIMANRLSAAKSKMKQKSQAQVERQKQEMLRLQQEALEAEAAAADTQAQHEHEEAQQQEQEQQELAQPAQAFEEQWAAPGLPAPSAFALGPAASALHGAPVLRPTPAGLDPAWFNI